MRLHDIARLAIAGALALTIASCTGGTNTDKIDIPAFITAVSAKCQELCKFAPVLDSTLVTTLLAAFAPGAVPFQQAVSSVANAICNSPPTATGPKGSGDSYCREVKKPDGSAVQVCGKAV